MKINEITLNQYEIVGETGIYQVTLNPLSCTCRDFTHRKKPILALCKHLKAVIDYKLIK